MKRNIPQIVFLILVSTICCFGQSNTWKTLTPLHSTRDDVEKLLGVPKDVLCKFGCLYNSPKENIRVSYVTHKCGAGGWNVPADTVLSIHVSSPENNAKTFDDLKLDKNKLSYTVDDAMYGTWTNAEEGLQYYFGLVDKDFISLTYIPKKSDNNLRCDGFPPFQPEGVHFTTNKLIFYNPALRKKDNLNGVFAAVDNFILMSLADNFKTAYKAYAIIYFDRKLPFEEYQSRLAELKQFIESGKRPPERLILIEGGMREESGIELYLLPKEWQPPAPDPTLPSPQFMKKRIK